MTDLLQLAGSIWANALTRTAPLVLRTEPSFTVSAIRRVSAFAN